MPLLLQKILHLGRIHDVSVVGQGVGVILTGEEERLKILATANVGSGITDMSDTGTTRKGLDFFLVKHFFHQRGAFVKGKRTVRAHHRNTAALLAAVLNTL